MNINLQRWIDRWVGIPACAAVSAVEALAKRFRGADGEARIAKAQKAPRAIVVILLSEMGSLVLAHDMFARLKQRFPDAPLHALMFGKNREILDLMQVMDPANVHTVDDKSLGGLLSSLWRTMWELRRANVDVAIDCELFSRISSILSYASGAVVRVGFHRHTQEGLYRGSHINRPIPYNPYKHISDQFMALARAIDSDAIPKSKLPVTTLVKPPPMVQLPPALLAGIEARLAQDFPQIAGKPLVLVYPGGGILPIRAWPLLSYTALCEGLVADGCAVAVIGLKDDQALAQELVANVQRSFPGSPVLDLTGYTRSISELLALFHIARLLVTNDGGPGQFAALTPIWTLMLFGPETPGLYAPVTPRCYSFYSRWPCSPCLTAYNHRSSYCDGDNQCLKVIQPADVLAKSRECLQDGPGNPQAATQAAH
ncbi:MAG: glycosyltransferase family 9 protein [Comamonadaceae bacterium]|nr:MAG: glycosyltransferase family 9 protein [Comamonadaceae bacterium]